MKDSASLDNKSTGFNAFNLISWIAVIGGTGVYLAGLWRSDMQLNEKGYYFAILLLGLFSSISIQKTVRDKADNIPTTQAYYITCIIAFFASIALIVIGLFNADLLPSEKGFYGIAFFLCLFGSISVQKNIRDMELTKSPIKKEFNTKSISEDD
ncbi:inner membrane protein YiaA [Xenorhabdus innexi]|uniref:inner membrane protein YiaA n=1 Tax=Xenorhabdus innexi TaxID=290109 RepID=A0A1N6MYZ5_9GAMM|nr:inner membrane protein YiaA [Xenorhabdus innexi]PHM33434.1 Inner membrane protein YiaA [Xenorhabdus innexi]SIP74093.1 Inner membrane protein yiaA [Xenorhabdus innexi]